MPVYLCRWSNGDSSVVLAANRMEAVEELDEMGNAEGCPLIRLPEFMVHFSLTREGSLRFEGFGEGALDLILENAYPILEKIWGSEDKHSLREAVAQEKTRVRPRKVRGPRTELGKEIKKRSGAATVMVDRIVDQKASDLLDKLPVPGIPH